MRLLQKRHTSCRPVVWFQGHVQIDFEVSHLSKPLLYYKLVTYYVWTTFLVKIVVVVVVVVVIVNSLSE